MAALLEDVWPVLGRDGDGDWGLNETTQKRRAVGCEFEGLEWRVMATGI